MKMEAELPDALPEPALRTLHEFRDAFHLDLRVWREEEDGDRTLLFPDPAVGTPAGADGDGRVRGVVRRAVVPAEGRPLEIEVHPPVPADAEAALRVLGSTLERALDLSRELRFFTYEMSERYEEINLLYSISEALGSILSLPEASRFILHEVCDVLGARRGSLWVHEPEWNHLRLVAGVGKGGLTGPLPVDTARSVTCRVFREGKPLILAHGRILDAGSPGEEEEFVPLDPLIAAADSVLSVPIRYAPLTGRPRTVGVINLIGRARGGGFTSGDQKLLQAIASQVGAAIENHRLIEQSLQRERMAREMELAHHLQMKLLPSVLGMEGIRGAARVRPAQQVGGDFYNVVRLRGGRIGVMIGDVSSHGFPAALIMALALTASGIWASEVDSPAEVLRQVDHAIRDELESTEMYLSLLYGVLDPADQSFTFANAGHPHAFRIGADGGCERLGAGAPPLGIADPRQFSETRIPFRTSEDLLLLFTDGLSDALALPERGAGGDAPVPQGRAEAEAPVRACGEEVVLAEVVRLRDRPPEEIVEGLFALALRDGGSVPPDDRTALVLKG